MSTTRRSRLRKLGVMSLVSGCITMGLAMTTGTPALADVTTVQGDATALSIGGTPVTPQVSGSATAPATGYGPIGTGELPSGVDCATGLVPTLPAVGFALNLALLEACTRGANVGTHQGFAESQARVVDLEIGTTDLGVITSACRADGDDAVGNTTIIGSPVLPENPTPGQVVQVPVQILPAPLPTTLLTLTLNEQIVTSTAPTAANPNGVNEITVNAVRLTVLGIDIIVAQSHCRATGPDVNVTTTLPPTTVTTLPPTTTTTTTTIVVDGVPPTTAPPTVIIVTPPPNNNTNTNTNENNNTSTNNNTNTNTNSQTQENTQIQEGGDNTNVNTNTINILGSNFDDFHRKGKFKNDDDHHDDGKTFGKALARTGSDSSRLTGLALLLLVVGAVLVLATRTMTPATAAVPAARRRQYLRSVFGPSRRWR